MLALMGDAREKIPFLSCTPLRDIFFRHEEN